MEEVKFRAWYEEEKRWAYSADMGREDFFRWLDTEKALENLCMYSGLKDKNGVEIWEKDLISVPYASSRPFLVVFIDGAFRGRHDISNLLLSRLIKDDEAIVISNIYESPELLEATDAAA